ncbi:MAG: TIGR03905 family TSCPD domain-containing protein [Candidatus Bruticola sp.]
MKYTYITKGTCSRAIHFDIEGDVISNVRFDGGCNGNLKGIAKLTEGRTVDEIEALLKGITCGPKPTSCPDQLARAVRQAQQETQGAQLLK